MLLISTVLHPLAAALAVAAPLVPGAWSAQDGPAVEVAPWREVVLTQGLEVDVRGRSAEEATDGQGVLRYDGERITMEPRLLAWTPLDMAGPSTSVHKDAGEPAQREDPAPGREYLFDLGDGEWGYLRVRARTYDALHLEVASGPSGEASLTRDPERVTASAEPRGHRLTWVPAEPEARYAIQRRVRGDDGVFVEVARVTGGSWFDEAAPLGRVVDYRVGRVQRDEDPPAFGARVAALRSEQPLEWPITLAQGMTIDLLSGDTSALERAHIEISHLQFPTLILNARPGVALFGPERSTGPPTWRAPGPWQKGYQLEVRRHVRGSGVLHAALDDGTVVRLELVERQDGIVLERQVDLAGQLLLPRPPREPELDRGAEGISLVFPELGPRVVNGAYAAIVVERERAPGDGVWEELLVGDPGQRVLDLGRPFGDDEFLMRLRFRHRLPSAGDSPAGPLFEVLTIDPDDEGALTRALDTVLADLGHEEFERRIAARVLLEALGDHAWPRLEAILVGDEPASVEVKAVVRDLLLDDPGGRSLPLVLRARAADLGVASEPPEWLFDPDPNLRAWALLRSHGSTAGAEWAGVLSMSDPDPKLHLLAETLLSDVEPPGPVDPEAPPVALVPPDQRPAAHPTEWRFAVEEGDPEDVAAWARGARSPHDPAAALASLLVAHRLEEAGNPWSLHGDLRRRAELALRLIDAHRGAGPSSLLEAAEDLVATPASRLRAHRELIDLRLQAAGPLERPAYTVETADITSLSTLLNQLAADEVEDVDVVLTPGVYSDESLGPWLKLTIDGLRLIGGEGVRLDFGLQVEGARDVVIEGLHVVSERSNALLISKGASVVVRDCHLTGVQTVVSVVDGRLEMDGTRVDSDPARPAPMALRTSGDCLVLLRRSLLSAGTLQISAGDHLYLDRCLVDSGGRQVANGQRGGSLVARSSLFTGRAQGFLHLEDLLLEGSVLAVPRDVLMNVDRAALCPETVRTLDPKLAVPESALLDAPILRR